MCVLRNSLAMIPEDFECDGSLKENPSKVKRRKGSFKKFNSRLRQKGETYTLGNSCNLVAPKAVKACSNCETHVRNKNFKCQTFTEDDRLVIFNGFYNLGSTLLQREFINRHVFTSEKQQLRSDIYSRRLLTNSYYLTMRRNTRRVCKQFFLATLAISEKMVRVATDKLTDIGTVERDHRGGRVVTNSEHDKIIKELVDRHIDRFPRVESHFCRKDSSKEYLSSDLTVKKMFDMYKSEHNNKKDHPSLSFYQQRFRDKNLAIHSPKKDQCTLCNSYRCGNQATKQQLLQQFNRHLKEKLAVRKLKAVYKKESLQSSSVAVAVFDLQQVISLPQSRESLVFYKRRFHLFNLTLYELVSKECYCSVWDETASCRGSSEISTCVLRYLNLCDHQKRRTVHLFCDGCPGQNKNSIIASMLIYFMFRSRYVFVVVI